MNDRMRKQVEFALLMDKQKNIFRQNHIADGSRRENDAERTHGIWRLWPTFLENMRTRILIYQR